jgi:hypothetical protein
MVKVKKEMQFIERALNGQHAVRHCSMDPINDSIRFQFPR